LSILGSQQQSKLGIIQAPAAGTTFNHIIQKVLHD